MKGPCVAMLLILCSFGAQAAKVTLLRTPDDGLQPQAAVDMNGSIHLIYFKGDPKGGDIFYVRGEPGKENFSKPIKVNRKPRTAIAIGSMRGAQLAIGKNGRVHLVWDGMGEGVASHSDTHADPTHGTIVKQPLYYTRFNDEGNAFEPERNIITYAYGLDGGSSVAADLQGNVYVTWHAPKPGNTNGEAGREVFVARSLDEGKTFQREKPATAEVTGACSCCGMKAFADRQGNVFALFRAASAMTNRNETLLLSRNHGDDFEIAYSHRWVVSTCPMSSAFLSESDTGMLAAAETHGRVFFVRVDPGSGKISSPISPEAKAKHPVVVANSKGEVLLAWVENTGWAKGGTVAWQVYDKELNPTNEKGSAEGVPAWSLSTAFVGPDDSFSIVY